AGATLEDRCSQRGGSRWRRRCRSGRAGPHGTSWTDLLSTREGSDALARLLRRYDQDPVVALAAGQPVIVEELQQRQDMLAARSGEIARSGDGDRPSGLELGDDRISEVSDRVREEDRLGPDADELSPLGASHGDERTSSRGTPARSGERRCAAASPRSTRVASASNPSRPTSASPSGTAWPFATSSAIAACRSVASRPLLVPASSGVRGTSSAARS